MNTIILILIMLIFLNVSNTFYVNIEIIYII